MILQLLYQNPIDNTLIPINAQTVPVLLMKNSTLTTTVFIKNVSDLLVTDLVTGATDYPAELSSVLTLSNEKPVTFISGMTHTFSGVLYPGDMAKLSIRCTTIDFTEFSLDLAFNTTLIDVTNLIAMYEFTEPKGTSVTHSSYLNVSSNPSPVSILGGDGYATFEVDNCRIPITVPSTGAISVFFKGFFYVMDSLDNIIFDATTFKIGINLQRQVFVNINGTVINTELSLIDPYEEYSIGVSLTSNLDLIITIDGSHCTLENNLGTHVLSISSGTAHIGDNHTRAKLSYFTLFHDAKAWATHSAIAGLL